VYVSGHSDFTFLTCKYFSLPTQTQHPYPYIKAIVNKYYSFSFINLLIYSLKKLYATTYYKYNSYFNFEILQFEYVHTTCTF